MSEKKQEAFKPTNIAGGAQGYILFKLIEKKDDK